MPSVSLDISTCECSNRLSLLIALHELYMLPCVFLCSLSWILFKRIISLDSATRVCVSAAIKQGDVENVRLLCSKWTSLLKADILVADQLDEASWRPAAALLLHTSMDLSAKHSVAVVPVASALLETRAVRDAINFPVGARAEMALHRCARRGLVSFFARFL
jgi:hypothetical protein